MKNALLFLAAALLVSACASGPTIVSNTSPGADFSQFKTFNFMQPLGTDRANGVRTPLSSRLVNSISRELGNRGMTRSEDPDLLVDVVVFSEERLDVRQTPSSTIHRSHWHHGFTTWPTYQTTVRQYTEGNLVIDLIDPRNNTLIAEGGAQDRINSDTQLSQQDIDGVVGKIFASIWAD